MLSRTGQNCGYANTNNCTEV